MSWHADILNEALRGWIEAEHSYPYLTALLACAPEHAEQVRSRAANLQASLRAERERPAEVSNRPYHVVLDPSSRCNLACPLCVQATDPRGRRRTAMSLEDYERILSQIGDSAIRLDLFNWGEPLLNPCFAEMVAAASSRGLYTRTSSHLSLKQGIDADALVQSGLKYLVLSIDAADQATYARYRVRGDLEVALDNLAAIVAARRRRRSVTPILDWQMLVLRWNQEQVDVVRELARSAGADVFRYGGARGRMSHKVLRSTSELYRESAAVLLPGDHPLSEYDPQGHKRWSQEQDGCRWLWGKLAIQADGGVTPCWSAWFKEHDLGHAQASSLDALWTGPAFRQARETACSTGDPNGASACSRCAHHRSFVNAPDTNDRALDRQAIAYVAEGLRGSGCHVSGATLDAVTLGLTDAAGEPPGRATPCGPETRFMATRPHGGGT